MEEKKKVIGLETAEWELGLSLETLKIGRMLFTTHHQVCLYIYILAVFSIEWLNLFCVDKPDHSYQSIMLETADKGMWPVYKELYIFNWLGICLLQFNHIKW